MKIPGMKFARTTARRLRDRIRPGGIILMYHSISERITDPWGNCVSPGNFSEHLDVLNRLGKPRSLKEVTNQLLRGKSPRGEVALTFDDGYADNYHTARHILQSHDTPATFFLVSQRMGSTIVYWWDELADILMRPVPLPKSLRLSLSAGEFEIELGTAASYSDVELKADRHVRAWAASPGTRLAFYYKIWKLLRPLDPAMRGDVLKRIREWAGAAESETNRVVTVSGDQANEIAAEGLIEIGSHSVSHPSLPDLDAPAQATEIVSSKTALEDVINRPVDSFAYPYGDVSTEAPALAKDAGYTRACTIVPRHARPGDDLFHLPRIAVPDCDGDEFEKRIFGFASR